MTMPVFIDIDGTLTDDPVNRFGNPLVYRISKVQELLDSGQQVVLWSAGGGDYAEEFAEKYNIYGAVCIGKPALCVDDNPTIRPIGNMKIYSPEEYFGD